MSIEVELESARRRFGRFLIRWRKAAGWSGATAERWAAACPDVFPGGTRGRLARSQWNELENGRVKSAQPSTFLQLAHLNAVLASDSRGAITDRTLHDRVSAMEPILHPDGTPWGAQDWFACYVGLLEPPERWRPPVVDADDLDPEETTKRVRGAFLSAAYDLGLAPSRAVVRMIQQLSPLADAEEADVIAVIDGEILPAERLIPAVELIQTWIHKSSSASADGTGSHAVT